MFKTTSPQAGHSTLTSVEKISTSSPHCGHGLIRSAGVPPPEGPGHLKGIFIDAILNSVRAGGYD
ncbi:MAG: hypothetical protein WC359_07640 [Dehalococcoidia bacterium]